MVNGKTVSTCSGCNVDGADHTEPEDDVTVSPSEDDELSVSSDEPVISSEDVCNQSGFDPEDISCWDAWLGVCDNHADREDLADGSPSSELVSSSSSETCSDNECLLGYDSI